MYDNILQNMVYKIFFGLDTLNPLFWNASNFLADVFFVFLGVEVGARIFKAACR